MTASTHSGLGEPGRGNLWNAGLKGRATGLSGYCARIATPPPHLPASIIENRPLPFKIVNSLTASQAFLFRLRRGLAISEESLSETRWLLTTARMAGQWSPVPEDFPP